MLKRLLKMVTCASALNGLAANYPSDLVFYSTFDSAASIVSPEVGSSGADIGATFQEGKYGQALFVPASGRIATFPLPNGLPAAQGCIEFNAKILGSDSSYGDLQPGYMIVRSFANNEVMADLDISSNNGDAGHGLIARHPLGMLRSHDGWGMSYDYSTVFGQKDPKTWHHYAIVWNTNGIAGSSCAVCLYLDGDVMASLDKSSIHCSDEYVKSCSQSAQLAFAETHSPFLIDEFRIWATEKTTFLPGPIVPVEDSVKVSGVTAKQHYPWCGKIDIGYTVAGPTDGLIAKISVRDIDNGVVYAAKTFDIAPSSAVGTHTVVWDATADGVAKTSRNMLATVSLVVPKN